MHSIGNLTTYDCTGFSKKLIGKTYEEGQSARDLQILARLGCVGNLYPGGFLLCLCAGERSLTARTAVPR